MMSERSHKKTPQLRFSTPASFPEKILDPGEEIRVHQRPHIAGLVWPTIRAIIYISLGFFILGLTSALAAGVTRTIVRIAFGVLLFLLLWRRVLVPIAQWMGSAMVVTSHRIIFRSGIFRKETLSVSLAWTQLVEVDQSFMGRMLGYGTVRVSSYELGGLQFDQIPEPHAVETEIRRGVTEMQQALPNRGYPPIPGEFADPYQDPRLY